jgi:hypothetical protein
MVTTTQAARAWNGVDAYIAGLLGHAVDENDGNIANDLHTLAQFIYEADVLDVAAGLANIG